MKKPSTASLRYLALLLGTVGLLWSMSSYAEDPRRWDPPGRPIRQGHHIEWQRAAYTDVNGYTLLVWSDTRTGDRDVFAQLIEPDGTTAPGWPVHVIEWPYRQEDPEPIVTDGGFIVTWIDFRFDSTGDVFAQKLNYAGDLLWNPAGVIVDTNTTSMTLETTLRGASDGSGGAVIAWEDNRLGSIDIFARRINSSGVRQWPSVLEVTNSLGDQTGITADTDGQGGLIVGWGDARDGGNVFTSKITNAGTLPWGGVNGVPVCNAPGRQLSLKLCPDFTTGGAYYVWRDERIDTLASNELFMQRFDGNGNAQWTVNGIIMCDAPDNQDGPRITPSFNNDVQDGVLTCWQDKRVNGSVEEVYAQKTLPNGTHAWTEDGVRVCGNAGAGGTGATRDNSRLTSDNAGGGLYAWDDTRQEPGNINQYDLYSGHLNASGAHVCGECGVQINTNVNQQQEAVLRAGGDGGFYLVIYSDFYRGSRTLSFAKIDMSDCVVDNTNEVIFGLDGNATNPTNIRMFTDNVAFVWEDARGGNLGVQIMYQVLNTDYERTFGHIPENGAPIAPVSASGVRFEQSNPEVCEDGSGGFYCSFENLTDGVNQIRLQQVGSDGQLHCDLSGAVVALSTVDQQNAQVVADGAGGCYVVWSGYDLSFQLDVYAMRMGPNCEPLWQAPVLMSDNPNEDDKLHGIAADESGCAVAVWETGEFGSYDLLAAKICADGSIAWQDTVSAAQGEQTEGQVAYDGQGGMYFVWSDTRDLQRGKNIYGQRFTADGNAVWTGDGRLVVDAAQDQKIPRLAVDSESRVFVAWQDFRNGAHLDIYAQKLNTDGSRIWSSEPSGRRICNAASDQSDQQLLVEWDDGLYMVWEDGRTNPYTDIYGVHIKENGDFAEPWWNQDDTDTTESGGPINIEYQNQTQPAMTHDWHGGTVVVWVDWRSSGKEPLENLWGNWVNDFTVGVSEVPAPLPKEYTLTQNYPNPFNPTTDFRFMIPATEAVKVAIYNTLGQQVEVLVDEVMHAGTYHVRFDASALASGVYFYRLETPSFQSVKKMTLIR